ncbi:MAG: response regulator transcription factor [Betaproteobacteria bacterium]
MPVAEGMLVLIVEDHDPMRRALHEFLRAAYPHAAFVEAQNAAQALELGAARRPHLVLMDVDLPDASGIELTARIRQLLPESAVIIVSQHAGRAYRESARAAGALAYVTKERVHLDLLPAVAKALGSIR